MSVSIEDWALAGLPLARTFVALSACPAGATAVFIAAMTAQDMRDVRVHLEEFLLLRGFALCTTDGVYTLTRSGHAQLNGEPLNPRSDHSDPAIVAMPLPSPATRGGAQARGRGAASSRKRAALG